MLRIITRIINCLLDGLTVCWAPFQEKLDTDRLIFPFRYDVIMREKFLSFFDHNRNIYFTDQKRFFTLAKSEPYYRFFIGISAAHNWVKAKFIYDSIADNDIDSLFTYRAERFIKLYISIMNEGYSLKHRIPLKCPFIKLSEDSKAQSKQKYFLGDGCHRLAILRHIYGTKIPSKYFRRIFIYKYPIRNNTLTLAKSDLLADNELLEIEEYCRRNALSYHAQAMSKSKEMK